MDFEPFEDDEEQADKVSPLFDGDDAVSPDLGGDGAVSPAADTVDQDPGPFWEQSFRSPDDEDAVEERRVPALASSQPSYLASTVPLASSLPLASSFVTQQAETATPPAPTDLDNEEHRDEEQDHEYDEGDGGDDPPPLYESPESRCACRWR
jgi:hypothetical protein